MAHKGLVASVIKCLTQMLDQDDLNAEAREGLEVAVQCLENAYQVQASDALPNFDILQMYKKLIGNVNIKKQIDPEAKQEAERLKNEGNNLLKCEKYQDAIDNYTKAIELDGTNAVFYCNRAAAYSKVGNHKQAIKDCHASLAIDPSYGKAYGRLGLAYASLDQYREAKESYEKALELEPDNESIKNNLQIAEEKLAQGASSFPGVGNSGFPMDIGSLISNPALMNMAQQMLSDPTMQNMVSNLMSGNIQQGGRMEALIEAGQQLAQQMQSTNPDLINSLREQMGGNQNDPDTTQ